MIAASTAAAARTKTTPRTAKTPRPFGTWVMVGVPLLLGLLFVWQIGSRLIKTEIIVHTAVAVSRVTLEADPLGSRVDLVVVDRGGADTTFSGDLIVKVREPDGTVWQTTRTVSAADFSRVPASRLLAGRVAYSVVVPAADWARAPRHGGSATVSINVVPSDGDPFSTVAEERFP
jgi:hypothetical protein